MTEDTRAIALPEALADEIAARVASGDFESESDVIRAGLSALDAQAGDVEAWITQEGAARYDAWRADPARATPAAVAFARVRASLAKP
jgi:Arc/MetJ-type ribon-helix-helix transcriptional regulator